MEGKLSASDGHTGQTAADCNRPKSVEGISMDSLAPFLAMECLFTTAGGFMDAYAFLTHGHVFANAQTGNVVLFAIGMATASWSDAIRHLPPIGACMLGVAAAKFLGVRGEKKSFRATLVCQAIELCVLVFMALFASVMPDAFVVPILSFVAALQFTSFDAVGPWAFNTANTTGNLKSAVSGLSSALIGEDPEFNRLKAGISGVACVSFLVGALLGGFWSHRHPAHALSPCVCLVFCGSLLTWCEHKKREGSRKSGNLRDRRTP